MAITRAGGTPGSTMKVERRAATAAARLALADDDDASPSSSGCSGSPPSPSCASRSASSASGCRARGRWHRRAAPSRRSCTELSSWIASAGEHVAERVLHGEGDHRGEDRRGGDEAGDRRPRRAAARSRRPRTRRRSPGPRRCAAAAAGSTGSSRRKPTNPAEADQRDRGDDARDGVHVPAASGTGAARSSDAGLDGEADEEQPQRVEVVARSCGRAWSSAIARRTHQRDTTRPSSERDGLAASFRTGSCR